MKKLIFIIFILTTTACKKEVQPNVAYKVFLYPNPTVKELTIAITSANEADVKVLLLESSEGKQNIFEKRVQGFESFHFDLEKYEDGVYTFETQVNGITDHYRIIKKSI